MSLEMFDLHISICNLGDFALSQNIGLTLALGLALIEISVSCVHVRHGYNFFLNFVQGEGTKFGPVSRISSVSWGEGGDFPTGCCPCSLAGA